MDKNYLKREIKTLFFFLIPYMCMGKDKIWKRGDLLIDDLNSFFIFDNYINDEERNAISSLKYQIFRNILNLNKYNPDNLEKEDNTPFFWRDIKS